MQSGYQIVTLMTCIWANLVFFFRSFLETNITTRINIGFQINTPVCENRVQNYELFIIIFLYYYQYIIVTMANESSKL